ncbi:MAG: xylulokinase [Epulopiscium sp.]|nr:xylulokinase [Candidatus Epulonipiscium sp.]
MLNITDKEYVLAYDVGSTGLKAVLFDTNGIVVASKYKPYETYYPLPTWIEQEPMEWWEAVCVTTRAIMEETEISPEMIKAIAPVGHQIMAVPVDKDGNLLRKRVQYCFDGRSSSQAEALINRVGGYSEFYKIHGLAHPPEILSICKAMWLKENEPEVYNKTHKFLQSKGFIILNLTDRQVFVDDFGDASNTGWLDITDKKYSKEIAEAAGIDIDKLPEIRNSHEIAGFVGQEAALQTGLKKGTPIFTGTGDVPASCIGAGVVENNMHYCSIGSANWNGGFVTQPCLDPDKKMVNVSHLWKDYICFQYTAAGSVSKDWFENSICDVEKDMIKKMSSSFYDITGQRAKKSHPGANGIFYIPYLRGGGGPHWNPNSRGAFVGLSIAHDKNDMARSVLEGVAYNFRWMMEQSKIAGVPIADKQSVRVIGGGARNEQWVQVYADVLGSDFQIVKDPHEATAKGGFILAAVGLKWFKDYAEAAKKTVAIEKIIEPNMEYHAIYNETFPVFKRVFQSLEGLFKDIAYLQSKYMNT